MGRLQKENVGATHAPRRILIVDDDGSCARVLASVFRHEGFEVATACDGLEAMDQLRRDGPYALVLSDVEMPRMSGLELYRHVHDEVGIPVVLMSGMERAMVVTLLGGEPEAFLAKPLELDAAVLVVRRVLAGRAC